MPHLMTKADAPTAIFGSWDGCISMLAVMVGLAAAHHLAGAVGAGTAGAVGGMFSMATGQYQSTDRAVPRTQRVREAVVMGLATGAGGMLPVAPYLLPLSWEWQTLICVNVAFVLATVVAYVKAHTDDDPAGLTYPELAISYMLLAVTAAATYAIGTAF